MATVDIAEELNIEIIKTGNVLEPLWPPLFTSLLRVSYSTVFDKIAKFIDFLFFHKNSVQIFVKEIPLPFITPY